MRDSVEMLSHGIAATLNLSFRHRMKVSRCCMLTLASIVSMIALLSTRDRARCSEVIGREFVLERFYIEAVQVTCSDVNCFADVCARSASKKEQSDK